VVVLLLLLLLPVLVPVLGQLGQLGTVPRNRWVRGGAVALSSQVCLLGMGRERGAVPKMD
jgi:hypothetical protein